MRISILTFLTIALLSLASCSSDEPAVGDGSGLLTFSVTVPEAMATRAAGAGASANDLRVVVFDKGGKLLFVQQEDDIFADSNTAQVTIKLVNGESYIVAFWVDDNYLYEIDPSTGHVAMGYASGNLLANLDSRDAFYAMRRVVVQPNSLSQSITLNRPFAQLNLFASDYDYVSNNLGKELGKTSLKVVGSVYEEMSLATGQVLGEPVDAEFGMNDIPAQSAGDAGAYAWLSMNYLLVDEAGGTLNSIELTTDYGASTTISTSIPLKRNFRTNITGDLLTDLSRWDVAVDGNMQGENIIE